MVQSYQDRQAQQEQAKRKLDMEQQRTDADVGLKKAQAGYQEARPTIEQEKVGVQKDRTGIMRDKEERQAEKDSYDRKRKQLDTASFSPGANEVARAVSSGSVEEADAVLERETDKVFAEVADKNQFTREEVRSFILRAAMDKQKLNNDTEKAEAATKRAEAMMARIKRTGTGNLKQPSGEFLKPRGRIVEQKFVNDFATRQSQLGQLDEIAEAVYALPESVMPNFLTEVKTRMQEYLLLDQEPEKQVLRQQLAKYFNEVLKMRSGTAVTESELKRMEKELSLDGFSKDVMLRSIGFQKEDLIRDWNSSIDSLEDGYRIHKYQKRDVKTGKKVPSKEKQEAAKAEYDALKAQMSAVLGMED
jgi:hypothetical protein